MDALDLIKAKVFDIRGQRPRSVRIGQRPGLQRFKAGDLVGRINGVPITFDPCIRKDQFVAYWGDVPTLIFL